MKRVEDSRNLKITILFPVKPRKTCINSPQDLCIPIGFSIQFNEAKRHLETPSKTEPAVPITPAIDNTRTESTRIHPSEKSAYRREIRESKFFRWCQTNLGLSAPMRRSCLILLGPNRLAHHFRLIADNSRGAQQTLEQLSLFMFTFMGLLTMIHSSSLPQSV